MGKTKHSGWLYYLSNQGAKQPYVYINNKQEKELFESQRNTKKFIREKVELNEKEYKFYREKYSLVEDLLKDNGDNIIVYMALSEQHEITQLMRRLYLVRLGLIDLFQLIKQTNDVSKSIFASTDILTEKKIDSYLKDLGKVSKIQVSIAASSLLDDYRSILFLNEKLFDMRLNTYRLFMEHFQHLFITERN